MYNIKLINMSEKPKYLKPKKDVDDDEIKVETLIRYTIILMILTIIIILGLSYNYLIM